MKIITSTILRFERSFYVKLVRICLEAACIRFFSFGRATFYFLIRQQRTGWISLISHTSWTDQVCNIGFIIIFIPCFFLPQGSKNDKAFTKHNLTLQEQGNRFIFALQTTITFKRKTNAFSLVDLLSLKINLDKLSDQGISNCISQNWTKTFLLFYHSL